MKIHVVVVVMLVFASIFIVVPLEKQSVSAGWYGTGYTYRVQITIDHTKVEGHLVYFPMLFNYTSPGFKSHAQVDGDDFVFCLNSTGAKLNHEIEAYDSATGYLRAWVNVTRVNHDSDVVIDLYYGNTTTTSNQNKNGVWNSGYYFVYHLDDSITYQDDSTVNNKDATNSGTSVSASGKFGSGALYDANADRLTTNATVAAMTIFTMELWAKFTNVDESSIGEFFNIRTNDPVIFRTTAEKIGFYEDGTDRGVGANICLHDNTIWHYILLVSDGTTMYAYVDKIREITYTGTTSTSTSFGIDLGDNGLGTDTFFGVLDEARLSKDVARNWSWVNTSYNNMNSPSTFYSVGVQTPVDLFPIVVSDVYPASDAIDVQPCPLLHVHVNHSLGYPINVTFYVGTGHVGLGVVGMIYDEGVYYGVDCDLTYYYSFRFAENVENVWVLNHKYFWYINVTDGMGNARWYPTDPNDDDVHWNFTTSSVNNTDAITVNDINLNTSVSHTEEYVNGTGWIVNYTSESQLNIQETLVNCTAINVSHWVSPFWDIWFNATGTGNGTGNASGSVIVNVNGRSFTWFFTVGLFGGVSFGMVLWRRKRRKEG